MVPHTIILYIQTKITHWKKIQVLRRSKKNWSWFCGRCSMQHTPSIQQQSATDKRLRTSEQSWLLPSMFRLCAFPAFTQAWTAKVLHRCSTRSSAKTVSITWTWFNAKTARLDTRSSSPTFTLTWFAMWRHSNSVEEPSSWRRSTQTKRSAWSTGTHGSGRFDATPRPSTFAADHAFSATRTPRSSWRTRRRFSNQGGSSTKVSRSKHPMAEHPLWRSHKHHNTHTHSWPYILYTEKPTKIEKKQKNPQTFFICVVRCHADIHTTFSYNSPHHIIPLHLKNFTSFWYLEKKLKQIWRKMTYETYPPQRHHILHDS